ncbi:MAG: hypothetical protein Q9166_004989 [cf. Caloplaca sp. 2 TL-2023]
MNNKDIGPGRATVTLKDEENSSLITRKLSITDDEGKNVQDPGQPPMRNGSAIMQQKHAQPMQHPESTADVEESSTDDSDRLCFFYGSLMDSGNLAWILGLANKPHLRPARIEGYRTMLWGPFPALIRAEDQSQSVSGATYQIESLAEVESQVEELQNLEGEDYERHRVRIRYDDGTSEWGWTFIWRGDEGELREGVFDLKAWRERTTN